MSDIKIGIRLYWDEQPGDCTPCKLCDEPIYLKKYVMVVEAGSVTKEIDAGFCESCYNQIIDGGV